MNLSEFLFFLNMCMMLHFIQCFIYTCGLLVPWDIDRIGFMIYTSELIMLCILTSEWCQYVSIRTKLTFYMVTSKCYFVNHVANMVYSFTCHIRMVARSNDNACIWVSRKNPPSRIRFPLPLGQSKYYICFALPERPKT